MTGASRPRPGADPVAILAPMRWWHLPSVVAIEAELFADTAWSMTQFLGELSQNSTWLQVLLVEAQVAGYLEISCSYETADLMTIALAPAWQHRGWGRWLLQQGMAHATTVGCQEMLLEVAESNPAAQLYRTVGFAEIARRHSYYANGETAIIMRAHLRTPTSGFAR